MIGRLRRRRRGFTLVELVVYFALVTTAMIVFSGIELGAQRAADMQQALITINTQAQSYLLAFRRDVEEARNLSVEHDQLTIKRLDGVQVIYRGIERRELDAQGEDRGRHVFRRLKKLTFSRDLQTGGVVVKVLIGTTLSNRDVVRRSFRRLAIPRKGSS